jgi:hypothetical protein
MALQEKRIPSKEWKTRLFKNNNLEKNYCHAGKINLLPFQSPLLFQKQVEQNSVTQQEHM